MNLDTLKQQLMQYAPTAIEYLKGATVDISEQVKDILHQIVMYYTICSGIKVFLGSIIIVGLIYYIKKYIIKRIVLLDEDSDMEAIVTVVLGILCSACILFSILIIRDNFDTFIKCLVAPKLFLIEYITALVK